MTKPAISTIWAVMMTKRNIWYIQYSKSHDLHGIIPCKSMYATLHFDIYLERGDCAPRMRCLGVTKLVG
ncbi:hypothetical protein ACN38_g4528 [Penicillium nordicum]|uniref:Uncharacterized protein n=1 Tax=Penicillium nordicum TaxID=229535 RepID=A0A0M8PAC2_9EURO|nr:hypothetical protein ACN38_g4528 [Penicillium nordicum]